MCGMRDIVQSIKGMPRPGERSRLPQPRTRIGHKLILSFVLLVMVVVGMSGWVLFELTRRSLEWQMRAQLVSVAQLVSTSLSPDVLRYLRPGREHSNLYRNLMGKLQRAEQMVGARHVFVFDRQRRSLLDTDGLMPIGREYPKLLFDRRELERVWSGHTAYSVLFFDEDDVPYMTGYAPIFASDGEVIAAVGVEIGASFIETVDYFGRSVLVFAALGALLTVVVAWGLARTLTRPIKKLVRAAHEIGLGNMGQAVVTSSDDEIGYLGETMEEMRRKLLARDAQLRQMLGGVAHEIRNPLGGIEIYAGLIADDLPDRDERKQHILKVIQEVRKLNHVIAEFLDFARPSPPNTQLTEIAELVADAAFILAPEMDKADIEYREEVAPDLVAYVDAEQVERVLVNLMKNAVQAMRGGGILTVRAQAEDDEVLIEVVDDGPGIPAEVLERLFEPFFTTKEQGSGLGLAMVSKTVEENRGRIEIESREGEGTACRLWLPMAAETAAEQMA